MKFTTGLSAAALMLLPQAVLANDSPRGLATENAGSLPQTAQRMTGTMASSGAQGMTKAEAQSYPYPDWPAIAKTAPPAAEQKAGGEKAAEETSPPSAAGKEGLIEKAGRALETLTGRSEANKAPATAQKSSSGQEAETAVSPSSYPDWPAIAKTAPPAAEQKAGGEKAAEETSPPSAAGKEGLIEKAGRALETLTGRSVAPEKQAEQPARSEQSTTAPAGPYPYPDWPAIAKTAPASN